MEREKRWRKQAKTAKNEKKMAKKAVAKSEKWRKK